MDQTKRQKATDNRAHISRIAAATFAVGGLVAPAFLAYAASAATSHATKTVTISTTKNKTLGTLLVSGGKTLYTLTASKTVCASACEKFWPEVVLPAGVTKATAGSGVSASKLGSVMHAGGVRQVTYNGKALYWYAGDKSAGQVNGNVTDTWGRWSDVVTVKAATSSGGGATPTTVPNGGGTAF